MSGGTLAAFLTGCATNPVSGKKQFMLLSENEEINLDRLHAPHQISADYGTIQDSQLNRYLATIGERLAACSHRPYMPFSFRGVNAVYVNAYAFPGGSIAVTRGMLLKLQSEAELAALLGHEIGHVAARHSAASTSKGMALNLALSLGAAVTQELAAEYSALASGLGTVSAGALLAHYSREAEREADALALEYMTRAGYNPDGCVALMDMLRQLSKDKPNIIELLFATHPMSEERYQAALDAIRTKYQGAQRYPLNQEQYLDQTARLRAQQAAIELMQRGSQAMSEKKFNAAIDYFVAALKQTPDDYAGLLLLADCRLTQKQWVEAERLAEAAAAVYPQDALALFILGLARIVGKHFDAAYDSFCRYDRLLAGNPNTIFFKGYALEGMQRRPASAEQYQYFLQQVQQGQHAQHARQRLQEWGYLSRP